MLNKLRLGLKVGLFFFEYMSPSKRKSSKGVLPRQLSPHKQNSAVSEESKQDLQKQVADEIELKQSQMEKFHQPAIAMGLVNGPSAVNLNVAD